MLLRVSGELAGESVDVAAVTAGDATSSGVKAGDLLVAFAEAATRGAPDLPRARDAVQKRLGPEALVDAAAIVANFERMVRIADASGIPLDTSMQVASADIRGELGIDDFTSSANTPRLNPIAAGVGAVARTLAFCAMRVLGRRG